MRMVCYAPTVAGFDGPCPVAERTIARVSARAPDQQVPERTAAGTRTVGPLADPGLAAERRLEATGRTLDGDVPQSVGTVEPLGAALAATA